MTGRYQVEEMSVAGLEAHPLSDEIFGQMPDDQFADLLKDIDERGLKYPLEVDARERVIAGSQRLRALKQLGWPAAPVIRHPELTDDLETEKYLIKDNTLRRQLTPMQMARAGAKLDEIYGVQAEARQKAGTTLPEIDGKVERHARERISRTAQDLGISRNRYEQVKTIFEKGSADLQDRVDRGEVSISKAAHQVRADKPRVAAREATEIQSAALRFARWQREIDGWTKQTKKATRWLQENPTDRLGPYAPRASGPCTELRTALQAALQEIQGEE